MPSQYKNNSDWLSFSLAFLFAIALIVLDARTDWLKRPRGALSVVLSPIQQVATLPTTISRAFSTVMSPEPDIDIAYKNLRNEYFQLKAETLLLRSLKDENKSLRSLLDASERLDEKIALAEIINVSIDPYNHRLLVNRGLRHGVSTGQAVIDDRGVIGQVTEAMPFNSSVMVITDPGHAIPVQVKRTGLRTTVYGTGSVSLLKVPFLNQNSDISVGDMLYSSGLGGRFPVGYPVAKVSSVDVIQDEAFIRVTAKPVAKLDRSNHVLLLSRAMPKEQRRSIKQGGS